MPARGARETAGSGSSRWIVPSCSIGYSRTAVNAFIVSDIKEDFEPSLVNSLYSDRTYSGRTGV